MSNTQRVNEVHETIKKLDKHRGSPCVRAYVDEVCKIFGRVLCDLETIRQSVKDPFDLPAISPLEKNLRTPMAPYTLVKKHFSDLRGKWLLEVEHLHCCEIAQKIRDIVTLRLNYIHEKMNLRIAQIFTPIPSPFTISGEKQKYQSLHCIHQDRFYVAEVTADRFNRVQNKRKDSQAGLGITITQNKAFFISQFNETSHDFGVFVNCVGEIYYIGSDNKLIDFEGSESTYFESTFDHKVTGSSCEVDGYVRIFNLLSNTITFQRLESPDWLGTTFVIDSQSICSYTLSKDPSIVDFIHYVLATNTVYVGKMKGAKFHDKIHSFAFFSRGTSDVVSGAQSWWHEGSLLWVDCPPV